MKPTDKVSGKPMVPNDNVKKMIHEDVWVDFVEDELDADFEDDLSLLLMNSQSDKNTMTNIRTLRGLIKSSDDVYLPEDGRIYDRMHDNIMAAIADKRPGSSFNVGARKSFMERIQFQARFSSYAGAAALSALVAVAGWFTLNKQVTVQAPLQASTEARVEAAIAASVTPNSISAEGLNVGSDDEFVADAASRKIASMSDQDYQALIQHLR